MVIFSTIIVPTIIFIIVVVGMAEKKDVFDIFCDGAKDGMKTMVKMFPTLIGIFLAVGMLRSSEILDFFFNRMKSFTHLFNIPNEILPLMFIKPVSGSASMALATDLMTKFGVDSKIGSMAGTIMSSSETTFYVIAVYLSSVKIRKSRKVLIPALIADFVCMIIAVLWFSFT
ncbi:MAG: spore maturation protein [Clostridia bacterium]|nr:spore maturation protein [Clostridia bacterium]